MADVTHEVGRKLDEHASLIRKLDHQGQKQGQVIERQGLDISEIKLRLGTMDTRLNRIDLRLDAMDTRFDRIDARFDGIDTRLDSLEPHTYKTDARLNSIELTLGEHTSLLVEILKRLPEKA